MSQSLFQEVMVRALEAATESPDPSTQNGAVLVYQSPVSDDLTYVADCNRFPDGVEYSDERWERPIKYKYVEHAERNAIFRAAKIGIPTLGTTLVCPWAACSDCARAIVQAGVTTLVRLPFNNEATGAHWHDDCLVGDEIFREGGVEIVELNPAELKNVPTLRRDGKPWNLAELALY